MAVGARRYCSKESQDTAVGSDKLLQWGITRYCDKICSWESQYIAVGSGKILQ